MMLPPVMTLGLSLAMAPVMPPVTPPAMTLVQGGGMETKLLTYAELAKALSITPASAKRLAIRRGWAKTIGNNGKAKVSVPVERLSEFGSGDGAGDDTGAVAGLIASDVSGVVTGDAASDDTPALDGRRQLQAYLESRVSELTGELKEARETIASLNETARRVECLQADARGLQALLEAEQKRSDELRSECGNWQGQAEKALAALPPPEPKRRGFFNRLFG